MDFNPNAKPNRIANGNPTHASLHYTFEPFLVDA